MVVRSRLGWIISLEDPMIKDANGRLGPIIDSNMSFKELGFVLGRSLLRSP